MSGAARAPIRLDLVYNPASGQFRRSRLDALAAALAEQGFAPRPIATRSDGVDLSADAQLVCIHGGDGTVRLAVAAMGARVGTVPLCIAPCGTINLIAREIGYDREPQAFASQLAEAWARGPACWPRSPLVTCQASPVMACLSLGPDSAAVAAVSPVLKARIGRLAYLVAAGGLLWHWPRRRFAVRAELADGSWLEEQVEAAFVARGKFYAGPFTLSPRARLDSALIELVVMPRAGRWRTAAFALAIMLGLPVERLGLARRHSVRSLEIAAEGVPMQIDGDTIPARALRVEHSGLTARFCA